MTIIYVPDLPIAATKNMPHLHCWLKRGAFTKSIVSDHATICSQFFGDILPIAPLRGLAEGLPCHTGYWLAADPVKLAAGLKTVFLQTTVTVENSADLIIQLNHLLEPYNIVCHAATPKHWYFQCQTPLKANLPDPLDVLGQDLYPLIAHLQSQHAHPALLTEIQMLLHQFGSDANSLWFWGGGILPALPSTHSQRPKRVWTDDVLMQGLAHFYKVPCFSFNELNATKTTLDKDDLIVFSACREQRHHPDDLTAAINFLENHLIKPLLNNVQQKILAESTLLIDNGQQYRISKWRLVCYFWR